MAASASLGAVGPLAATHHGAFTRKMAAKNGLKPHGVASLIRRGVIEEPVPGLLVIVGSPVTLDRHLHAAALLLGSRGVIADETAAFLHGVDGFDRPDHVGVLVPKGIRVRTGSLPITVRQTRADIPDDDVWMIGELRVTGLARTICDLAATADRRQLERYIDDFERRGHSLTWLHQTATRLNTTGRVGPPAVLAEIAERKRRRREGRQVRGPWFQKLVKECLQSPLMAGLVEEYEIRDDEGRVVARCDLAIPAVRLGIEAHSRRHHFGADAEAYDEQRDNRVAELGWMLRYVTWNDQARRPEQARAYFERLVARRAADLGVVLTPP